MLDINVGGKDMKFKVVRRERGSAAGTPGKTVGYGHYIDLDPQEDYGSHPNIDPTSTEPSFVYNKGNHIQTTLDVIHDMGEKVKVSHPTDSSTTNTTDRPGEPGYGEGGTGGAQSNDQLTAGRQLAYDTINRASAQSRAKSALGAKIGQGIDDVARRMVPDQKKEVRGASVYAQGGQGGVAHQQIVPTGDARYDAKRQKELTNRIS